MSCSLLLCLQFQEKIVELLKEVEFAKKFHKDRLQAKEDEETFELQHSLIAKGGTSVDA